MRRIGGFVLAGLLLLALQACGQQAAQDPEARAATRAGLTIWSEPRQVPTVSFVDGEGKSRSLADFHGKVVLLNVWATWCGPCRKEMPTLDRLQQQLGGATFEVVALSIDQAGEGVIRAFYSEVGIRRLALYIDHSAQAAIDLSAIGLPTTLLLDAQGREVGRKLGAAEWDSPEIVAYLREILQQTQRTER